MRKIGFVFLGSGMNLKEKLTKNRLTVTLMVSLPRGGKSTWIKNNVKNQVVVCPDIIRKLIFGQRFHKNSEDFVWAYAKGMAKLLLEQGKSIVIDATNLTFWRKKSSAFRQGLNCAYSLHYTS